MLSLAQAARFFDKNVFVDTYGTATFLGQILPYSDSVRSGSATLRRILDIGPDVVLPTRRTITSQGETYIVANGAQDLFNGGVIRVKHPIMPVYSEFNIRSIGQVLAGAGGTTGYMRPSYIRRNILEDQSDYLGGYEIYFSSYNSVPQGHIVHNSSHYFRARELSRTDDIGFGVVEAVELDNPVSTMTFQARGTTYDPVGDDYNPPAAVPNVSIFLEHVMMDYDHEALGFIKIEPGDKTISFLKSQVATISVGDSIGPFKILSFNDNGTFWTTHARR